MVDSHSDCLRTYVIPLRSSVQSRGERTHPVSTRGTLSIFFVLTILTSPQELYTSNFYKIDWYAQRNNIAKEDLYSPHTMVLDTLYAILGAYESCHIPPLRRAALKKCYDLIVREDENTGYQTLGPVSKMMNLVARVYVEGRDSEAYKLHMQTRQDFMWIGEIGMMLCGTNGSQLWDMGFITQALVETGLASEAENQDSLVKALEWLDVCQIKDHPRHFEVSYRHPTKGAWPFSTRTQGYTVSDCTGEGLKAVLYIQNNVK